MNPTGPQSEDRLLSPKTPLGGSGDFFWGVKMCPRRWLESSAAEQEQTKIECVPWMLKTKRSASTESSQETWKA